MAGRGVTGHVIALNVMKHFNDILNQHCVLFV